MKQLPDQASISRGMAVTFLLFLSVLWGGFWLNTQIPEWASLPLMITCFLVLALLGILEFVLSSIMVDVAKKKVEEMNKEDDGKLHLTDGQFHSTMSEDKE